MGESTGKICTLTQVSEVWIFLMICEMPPPEQHRSAPLERDL